MFRTASSTLSRSFTAASQRRTLAKVTVLGAAGGIGQPLSLLLAHNPHINRLALYDIVNTPGVAADLSHMNKDINVTGHVPANDGLAHALKDAHAVVIPAGVPRKPGMTRDDLFNTNASIVHSLATACAQHCPQAHILVISNPVNSTVPIVAEVFKKHGVYDPKRIFGVTTLDVVRASKFVSEYSGIPCSEANITVVGGHSGVTIVPLFSHQPGFSAKGEDLDKLTYRVQFGGDEVVKAKDGLGSATLSMAFAGARFTSSLLRATVGGESGVIEPTFVENPAVREQYGVEYFATNVELGPQGVGKIHEIGTVNAYEQALIEKAVPELKKNIAKGVEFASKA